LSRTHSAYDRAGRPVTCSTVGSGRSISSHSSTEAGETGEVAESGEVGEVGE
jgi:hypothetical protein